MGSYFLAMRRQSLGIILAGARNIKGEALARCSMLRLHRPYPG